MEKPIFTLTEQDIQVPQLIPAVLLNSMNFEFPENPPTVADTDILWRTKLLRHILKDEGLKEFRETVVADIEPEVWINCILKDTDNDSPLPSVYRMVFSYFETYINNELEALWAKAQYERAMNTKIREPFPLFPITDWEREKLLEVAAYYVKFPTSQKGLCAVLGYLREPALQDKIVKSIAPCSYYSDYLAEIGRYDLAATPAKSRLHWVRLLVNQGQEGKQNEM